MPEHLVLVTLERFSSSATNEPRLTREPVVDCDSGIDLDYLATLEINCRLANRSIKFAR